MKDKIIAIRREIHRHPEMAFEEYNTAKIIAEYLKELGLEPKCGIAKTGITADICGKEDGKTILLRADMDALPVTEQTGLEFSSETPGIMHACGHDIHISTLLACATTLVKQKDKLNGRVRLLFQPAEEATGGAEPMINEGVMENPEVNAAFAFHISNEVPLGSVLIREGGSMASPDHFYITIKGKGGHGARPELCINPIDAGSYLVCRLKEIKCDQRFVVSICSFVSGASTNIIPDTATLMGTARSLDPITRQYIYEEIKKAIKDTEEKFSAEIELDYHFLYPPLVNDVELTREFAKTAKRVLGDNNVVMQNEPDMIGEDFAYFAEKVPACMAKLGGANKPLHSSDFIVDEDAIFIGAELMAEFVKDYLG